MRITSTDKSVQPHIGWVPVFSKGSITPISVVLVLPLIPQSSLYSDPVWFIDAAAGGDYPPPGL